MNIKFRAWNGEEVEIDRKEVLRYEINHVGRVHRIVMRCTQHDFGIGYPYELKDGRLYEVSGKYKPSWLHRLENQGRIVYL